MTWMPQPHSGLLHWMQSKSQFRDRAGSSTACSGYPDSEIRILDQFYEILTLGASSGWDHLPEERE